MEKKKLPPDTEQITVKGARTHNLKNITVAMPRNKLIAFTGLSGSGKSSLAFDTIFAEGQRRYVESLSAYARQFLRQLSKPDVDEITGLSPAISIDQKSRSSNPRSTVATITEIYDYLRILFARIGKPYCLVCNRPIERISREEIKSLIVKKIQEKGRKTPDLEVKIFSPLIQGRKGEYYQLLYDLLEKGYSEVLVDGEQKKLREQIILKKNTRHDIDVLVDKIKYSEFYKNKKDSEERLGEDLEKALDESNGLVKVIFKGREKSNVEEFVWSSKFSCPHDGYSYPEIEPRLFSFNSPYGACPECNGLGTKHFWGNETCERCHGQRLREEALAVKIKDKSIMDITSLTVEDSLDFFQSFKMTPKEKEISQVLIKEITSRLEFMMNVGIEYLTLNRKANTLSGGEAQRIRLATQLGSGLVGALYVLDEPTIGLHPRDNQRLVNTLKKMRDLGNTIIVVEHDEDTIFSSDFLVDIGPGAGVHGGQIVVADYLEDLITASKNKSGSVTLDYLRGDKEISIPANRRNKERGKLIIKGGKIFNIKNLNVEIPLERFVAITGVSGSGKSSFLYEILHRNLIARFDRRYRSAKIFNCKSFEGTEYLQRAILIDQSPIGRTPRSNPATYTGAFTFIRELFAQTSEAKARGWKSGRFSFNVKGGRCESCQGKGSIEVEMHFLPTVYVTCDVCNSKKFMKETLEVEYKKKNIYDVLSMTVEEALDFFKDIPAIYDRLKTMNEVGLGYLELGQSATTLSGGEAQRIKISSELYRPYLQKTIYLLDEPTVGLHYEDVRKLIDILQKLISRGNTVVVIEHNMSFIKNADFMIDFGPEGGNGGGNIIAKGTPENVAQVKDSHTGKFLKRALKR